MFNVRILFKVLFKEKFCLFSIGACYLEGVEQTTSSIPSLVLWVRVLKASVICWKDDADTVTYHVAGQLQFQRLSISIHSTGFINISRTSFFPLYMNIFNSSCRLLRQIVFIDEHFFLTKNMYAYVHFVLDSSSVLSSSYFFLLFRTLIQCIDIPVKTYFQSFLVY